MDKSGISLDVVTPETPVWVNGDSVRLSQILSNLLENAEKFTDRGGRVTVTVQACDDQAALLSVQDTGIGMEAEVLAQVFESFMQGERSLDRSRGGLGLGLALVKGLAGLHFGEVSAASEGLGKGSCFTVRLPLSAEEPPTLPILVDPDDDSGRDNQSAAEGRRLKVLVVEDIRDSAVILRDVIELWGHTVEVASSGTEGWDKALTFRPDVAICDIGLPGMDGYSLARELRSDPRTAQIDLIALTGYGQEENRKRSLAAGYREHLTKPVEARVLRSILDDISRVERIPPAIRVNS